MQKPEKGAGNSLISIYYTAVPFNLPDQEIPQQGLSYNVTGPSQLLSELYFCLTIEVWMKEAGMVGPGI